MVDSAVKNTYVFTEKDLPGFKSKSKAKFDAASANMPSRLTRLKDNKAGAKQPFDPNKRFQPYFRKAIPSKFSIQYIILLLILSQSEPVWLVRLPMRSMLLP